MRSSPRCALQGTIQGLVAQRDHGVRAQIVRDFVARFPDATDALQRAVQDQDLDLDVKLLGGGGKT